MKQKTSHKLDAKFTKNIKDLKDMLANKKPRNLDKVVDLITENFEILGKQLREYYENGN